MGLTFGWAKNNHLQPNRRFSGRYTNSRSAIIVAIALSQLCLRPHAHVRCKKHNEEAVKCTCQVNFVIAILGGLTRLINYNNFLENRKYISSSSCAISSGTKCWNGEYSFVSRPSSSPISLSVFPFFRRREIIVASFAHSKYGSTQGWRLHLLGK